MSHTNPTRERGDRRLSRDIKFDREIPTRGLIAP
jgi:hypothetical protein